MKNGILKIICFSLAISGVQIFNSSPTIAQDKFREFDRRLVVTPAELYKALSTLSPGAQEKAFNPQSMKGLEEAGRKLLEGLSADEQEKVWEFAEKHLRKNGVDHASSKELMREFGLPPEMQNELIKQFKKFSQKNSKRGSNADLNSQSTESGDEISQLLQRAREKFQEESRNQKRGSRDVRDPLTPGQSLPGDRTSNSSGDKRNTASAPDAGQAPNRSGEERGSKVDDKISNRKSRPRPRTGNEPSSDPGSRPIDGITNRSGAGIRKRNEGQRSGDSRTSSSNRSLGNRSRSRNRTPSDFRKPIGGSDAEIENFLNQLDGTTKQKKNQGTAPGRISRPNAAGTRSNVNWEQVIKGLAEEGVGNIGDGLRNGTGPNSFGGIEDLVSKSTVDKDMFDRAQNIFSKALKGNKGSGPNGSTSSFGSSDFANEKIGTRFDRLLVKAVDRTLTSGGDEGISDGVGDVLGGLIERFQDRAAKKKEAKESTARQSSPESDYRNNRRENRSSRSSQASNSNRSINRSNNRSTRSDSSNQFSSAMPKPPSLEMGSLSEMVPDISGINPSNVFIFFAVVGGFLFLGYMLAQSFESSESGMTKREVIKKVRSTQIKSPKDLVETVDMFLLAKFGIKSSWWNARLAQNVLHSGSSELKSQVDELFRDYVRARYMRDDIEIPAADQNRFRKTLEALSKLDIKPARGLGYVSTEPTVSLEG